jgi:hypothetical protein
LRVDVSKRVDVSNGCACVLELAGQSMRRAVLVTVGAVLLSLTLGAMATPGIEASAFPLILPANPLSLLSN